MQEKTEPAAPEPPVPSPLQRRALAAFALAAALALVWLSLPVASGLFLGTLLAFSLHRVYERLLSRLRRPGVAALVLALASALVILGGLAVLFSFVISRGTVAANALARGFDPGGALRGTLTRIEDATRSSAFGPIDVVGRVREAAALAASELTTWAAAVASLTATVALTLFFTIMATFFVLRHWMEIVALAERMLPLHPTHTRVVLSEFQRVGKEVFVGTILTGLAQGLLAAFGYAICGVPEAALLGTLTAICSLVPAIGTLIVWVPVGVVLALTGRVAAGVGVLAWGTLVVVIVSDYVIRPRLVGGKGHVPTLFTFISLFGGVEIFGLIGLIVGPVIASVALALLRTYDQQVCAQAARAGQDVPGEAAATKRELAG